MSLKCEFGGWWTCYAPPTGCVVNAVVVAFNNWHIGRLEAVVIVYQIPVKGTVVCEAQQTEQAEHYELANFIVH